MDKTAIEILAEEIRYKATTVQLELNKVDTDYSWIDDTAAEIELAAEQLKGELGDEIN